MSAIPGTPNFDRLAPVYRVLECIAFGRDLERVRFCFLDHLAGCRNILVLGEGDGRCLARLVESAPFARIECVDASSAMLALAERRLPARARRRVTFTQADIAMFDPGDRTWDAIVTFFVLDCFTNQHLSEIIRRFTASLHPGGLWLFGDFAEPPRGWPRWRAHAWLAVLYRFFHWSTRIEASRLPDAEALLVQAGLALEVSRTFEHGLLRTCVYRNFAPASFGGTAPAAVTAG